MRRPRDFDAALRVLTDKTKVLKENKRRQLGELVVATGADALDMEMLAGGLLAIVETADTVQKENWRSRAPRSFGGKHRHLMRRVSNRWLLIPSSLPRSLHDGTSRLR